MSTHCKSAQLGSLDVYLVASLAAVIPNTLHHHHQRQKTHKVCDRTECLQNHNPQVSLLIIIASLPGTIIIGKLCLVLLPVAYGLLITLVVRWVFT